MESGARRQSGVFVVAQLAHDWPGVAGTSDAGWDMTSDRDNHKEGKKEKTRHLSIYSRRRVSTQYDVLAVSRQWSVSVARTVV